MVSATLQSPRAPGRRSPVGAARRTAAALGRIAAGLLAFGLCACGSSAGPSSVGPRDFGRLAGYVWTGQVRSVHGSWRVPAIAPGSPAGHGSTWIGAQVAGPSNQAPFIQVGITEDRVPGASGALVSRERAFWSATSLGFHPHFLWPVRAGDRIGATLARLTGRWQVDIADLSSGRRAAFATSADAQGSFAVAEWLQEDPTANDGSRMPYPRLTPTRFAGLAVNGASPRYADVAAQWMSLPGTALAPTPLHPGGFSIGRAALSRAGARYLTLAARADHAQAAFDAEASGWRRSTPVRRIVAAAKRLRAAIDAFAAGLGSGSWPRSARGAIGALSVDLGTEAGVLLNARSAARQPGTWTAQYQTAALTSAARSRLVRRVLHMPEVAGPA